MGLWRKDVKLFIAGIVLTGISLLFFVCIFLSFFYTPYKYVIGIDAGSSHSELILYRWKIDKYNNTGLVEEVTTCEIDNGVASLGPETLRPGLNNYSVCLDELYEQVPSGTERNEITVYLGATAGARILKLLDPARLENIFRLLRALFAQKGFNVGNVDIIDGKYEGLYAWITINYLTERFFSSLLGKSESHTILDQGGASAQIAEAVKYEADSDKYKDDIVNITLYGNKYSVYAFTNLCFGSNEWFQRYLTLIASKAGPGMNKIRTACLPIDYTIPPEEHIWRSICLKTRWGDFIKNPNISFFGTGDFDMCVTEITELIDPSACAKKFSICPKKSQVKTVGENLYAISTYYYVMKGLGLDEHKLSRNQFVEKMKSICSLDISQLKNHIDSSDKYLPYFCAKGVYILKAFDQLYQLTDGDWAKLRFTNKIDGHSLGWLMGYIIAATNNIPAHSLNHILMVQWKAYFVLFLIFLILAVALFYNAKRAQQTLDKSSRSSRPENTELKCVSQSSI